MWFEEAKRLRLSGATNQEISKKLNINRKTVEKRFLRDKQSKEKQPELNLQDKLIVQLQKEQNKTDLCKINNISERVLHATIDDLKDYGYNIFEFGETVRITKVNNPEDNIHKQNWNGEKVIRFGVVSDTHLGNKCQQLTFLRELYDMFDFEGIDMVYHSGDLSDGYYRTRPGHIYELIDGKAGSDAQAEYIIDIYPKRNGITTQFITGNHDNTHIMNGGANIGKAISREREDMIYLGCDNAKIYLTPNCILELNHPMDGASYAISYTLQKLIDSMSGGEKPNILINGHHHKAMYLFYRNIHAFEAGTIQSQTPFMKGKKLSAHIGGWIIEAHVSEEGYITRCCNEFIPLYVPRVNDY